MIKKLLGWLLVQKCLVSYTKLKVMNDLGCKVRIPWK